MTHTIVVVGDRFQAFADQTSAQTASQLVGDVRSGLYEHGVESLTLLEGQGLTAYDRDRIRDELARCGLVGRITLRETARGLLCRESDAHKHREENVLIAGLTRLDDNRFRACLRMHNDEELLLDHQASHVQGMVIVEAARQMLLAVSERRCAARYPGHRYSHVFNRLEVSFWSFMFPLEADIRCTVLGAETSGAELMVLDMEFVFEQAGRETATIRTTSTAVQSTVLAKKERRAAERILRHALEHTVEEGATR